MLSRTYKDEIQALYRHWPIWYLLGMQDIKLRYRRSSIGPFWITISMAVTVFSMGFLYSHLFHTNLAVYFPYLTAGIISWAFLSTLIMESTNCFIEAENYIRNQESYLSLFIMRIVLRNAIVLLHNLLVLVPVMVVFHIPLFFSSLLVIPGVILAAINALSWGSLFALIGTRFRDFNQIMTSLVQVIFFITPVMWMPDFQNPKVSQLAVINPFYHLLNLIREPLLGHGWQLNSCLVVLGVTLFGFLLNTFMLTRYKNRIVFWL